MVLGCLGWTDPISRNVKESDFLSQTMFESIRERGNSSHPTTEFWLAGPEILRIRANVISLSNVVLTGDRIQLGPGPDRRGYFTSDSKDLPRFRFQHYQTVRTLRGRRSTNRRLLIREDQLPLCGWVALDDGHFAPRQDLYDSPRNFEHGWFALLAIDRAPSGGLAYLGIFLVLVEGGEGTPCKYQRIGCGQLSHSFISGEELDNWSPNQDELVWSTKSDKRSLYIPQYLSTRTTIDIEQLVAHSGVCGRLQRKSSKQN
jgi:hypothetical protein